MENPDASKKAATPEPNETAAKSISPSMHIARRLLPDVDPQSGVLPSDAWVLSTAADILKNNDKVREPLKDAAVKAGGGAALLLAGVAVTAGFAASLPFLASAAALATVTGGVAYFDSVSKTLEKIKRDVLPEIQRDVAVRYMHFQCKDIADVWGERYRQARQEKNCWVPPHVEGAAAVQNPKGSLKNTLRKWFLKKSFETACACRDFIKQNPPPPVPDKPKPPQ